MKDSTIVRRAARELAHYGYESKALHDLRDLGRRLADDERRAAGYDRCESCRRWVPRGGLIYAGEDADVCSDCYRELRSAAEEDEASRV